MRPLAKVASTCVHKGEMAPTRLLATLLVIQRPAWTGAGGALLMLVQGSQRIVPHCRCGAGNARRQLDSAPACITRMLARLRPKAVLVHQPHHLQLPCTVDEAFRVVAVNAERSLARRAGHGKQRVRNAAGQQAHVHARPRPAWQQALAGRHDGCSELILGCMAIYGEFGGVLQEWGRAGGPALSSKPPVAQGVVGSLGDAPPGLRIFIA